MNLNKIFLPILAGAALIGSFACTDEVEYTPAPAVGNPPAYFSPTMATTVSIPDNSSSFNVTVYRADTLTEFTTPVTLDCDPAGIFSVDGSVSFAVGENTARFQVKYDISKVEVNVGYHITLTLPEIEPTDYTRNYVTLTATYVPWQPITFKEEDGTINDKSMAIYREDCMTTFFNVENLTYEVPIQEHPTTPGLYRLVDPYGAAYPYNEPGDYNDVDDYWVIDCTDPNAVVPRGFWTGMAWADYGEVYITSRAYNNMAGGQTLAEQISAGYTGTVTNGIIRMPNGTLFIGMENFNWPSIYAANSNGMFKVVIPGYDDEPEWIDLGWCEYTDGFAGELAKDLGHKYEVFVQASNLTKGLYRIVNLFGAESGYVTQDPANPVYTTVNATNKDCVLFGSTVTPFKDRLNGTVSVTTQADLAFGEDNGYDELIKQGLGGQFKNNVITLSGTQVRWTYSRAQKVGQPKVPVEVRLDLSNPRLPEPEPEDPATAAMIPVVKTKVLPAMIMGRLFNTRDIEK